MASLTIKGLAKSFGGAPALAGIDLSVAEGELCVLVGPSGAGKSTLLRAIAGLEWADAGTIEIDGEVVNDWQPRERNIAMVFQTDALLPASSVYENIAFSLRVRKMSPADVETRVRHVAELLGIADQLRRPAGELGPAGRRRTAIARAFVRDADLHLLDDPLADIGAEAREAMRGEIKKLHREFPGTKLCVVHDAFEAMALGERVVMMRAGRIEQEGTPLDLFERPRTRFVGGYFGWPKMNFLNGTLIRTGGGDSIRLNGGETTMRLPPHRVPEEAAEGFSLILGVRPEHMMRAIRVSPADGAYRHEAEIEALQPAGPRTYATFKLAGAPVTAELQAHDVTRPGERISIDINLKRASIFDAATDQAL